ncbi:glutamyl-tRNA synthetase /glutamate--tRNA(Gln) ligase [Seinonella peptonophila]|uniref:Glutamate--tRNA ligase n=1 Tax=Seinonella peptonophila TaxID=112248 RepID=A0A1M4X6D2_9BACL|nr:glutamate--tRNA ligase [Seinonella peptonophila]SHE89058.1 glutamyl-tRNA synthetase /glutamate--tRNA(Gln) ligase [Seinonella peptonophila]
MSVRMRFAPSPTGHLHIGGARTALFNYLFAKQQGGSYILRIEDTDLARNREDALQGIIDGFRWLGLDWDEGPEMGGDYGPYSCMERLELYQPFVEQLLAEGKAYKCYCSSEQLATEKEAAKAEGRLYRYPGTCRHLTEDERTYKEKAGADYTIRFAVPASDLLDFDDLIRGDVRFTTEDVEDFVIVKSDGIPTYHFAVTIDDHLMEITHVVRGEEHISNTPKQILLYRAFGWEEPRFGHLPLILNPNGKKLSKRDGSIIQFIDQYKELGYLPEAVINYLALLGWSPSDEHSEQELFTKEELIEQFSYERVNRSGAVFDPEKLAWVNAQYIKASDPQRIVELALPYLEKEYDRKLPLDWVTSLVTLYQTAIQAIHEIVDVSRIFFQDQVEYNEEAKKLLQEEHVSIVLQAVRANLAALGTDEYLAPQIKKAIRKVQKETGYRGKQLFLPVRVATTGESKGPDLNETLALLGQDTVLQRLEQALST